MIVDKIMDYLGGNLTEADDARLAVVADRVAKSLKRNMTKTERSAKPRGLSASSPWYCGRRVLYELNNTDRAPLNPRSRIAFLMGDTLEVVGIELARLAGVDVISPGPDGRQHEAVVTVGGNPVACHLDMTIRDVAGREIPVDWKSMADYGFGEFERASQDPEAKWWTEERFGYLAQLRIYMKAIEAPYGIFVAVNKNTGVLAELHVKPDAAFDEEIAQRSKKIVEWIGKKETPPRPTWATSIVKEGKNLRPDGTEGPVEEVQAWRCGYCPFISTCWSGFGLVPLKSKPVWRRAVEPQATVSGGART